MAYRHYQLLGHEKQCYRFDNKCHCSSSEPYLLPPEPPLGNYQEQDTPLSTQMSPFEIIETYKLRCDAKKVQPQTSKCSRTAVDSQSDSDIDVSLRSPHVRNITNRPTQLASSQGHEAAGASLSFARCNQDNSRDRDSSIKKCKSNTSQLQESGREDFSDAPPSYESLFLVDDQCLQTAVSKIIMNENLQL